MPLLTWELRCMQITLTHKNHSLSFQQIIFYEVLTWTHCMASCPLTVTHGQMHFYRSGILQQARQFWYFIFILIFKFPTNIILKRLLWKTDPDVIVPGSSRSSQTWFHSITFRCYFLPLHTSLFTAMVKFINFV